MSLEQVLWLAAFGGFALCALVWAGVIASVRQADRTMREQGCWCPAGRDGYHLPDCPMDDPAQQGGA
jgi:uncharacterized protein YjhX (UPF0386 family)